MPTYVNTNKMIGYRKLVNTTQRQYVAIQSTCRLRSLACRAVMSTLHGDTFFLDEFADRQWNDPNFSGMLYFPIEIVIAALLEQKNVSAVDKYNSTETQKTKNCVGTRMNCDKQEFLDQVHAEFKNGSGLVNGYAPFCKHLFVRNEYDCTVGAIPITPENKHLLVSGYTRRRPEELAVLTRWFPTSAVTAPRAKYLDIILYSREQLIKEHAALYGKEENEIVLPDCPWGIISIKAQSESYETPMNPITMLRNALGKSEGGSGVPIDRKGYEEAVAYWDSHAMIQ